MASTIEVTFEFEIGELVFFRGAQHTMGSRPRQFCIVTRYAQECPNGVQKLYQLDSDGNNFHLEVALTRDEPEYRPVSAGQLKEELGAAYAQWTSRPKVEPGKTGEE